MIDPMFARLAGCLLVAALFTGLLATVAAERKPGGDVVAAAELHHRLKVAMNTRP